MLALRRGAGASAGPQPGQLLNNMERRRSLYQLPWYLALGEENAGKTSLIRRSNQSFALSHVTKAEVRVRQEE